MTINPSSVLLTLRKEAFILFILFFFAVGRVGGEGRQARSKNTLDFLFYSHVIRAPL